MSEQLLFWKGNLEPSINDRITTTDGNGVTSGVDLTAYADVRFRMRPVGGTITVDRPVSFKDAAGNWRYDWQAGDTDEVGQHLVWIRTIDGNGKTQDVAEAMIVIADHVPIEHGYLEPEQWKTALEMTNQRYADQEIEWSIESASRIVDHLTGRRFWADADATEVRYYTAEVDDEVWIDDLLELTSVETAPGSDGVFSQTWTRDTDFRLAPYDAPAKGYPWRRIELTSGCRYRLPSRPHAVKITGQWGWAAPPANVVEATLLIATQLVRRVRDAPFGIIGFGIDGQVARINRTDPDLVRLLEPYTRKRKLGMA
jgi:hypothetical protein